jgi:hypothetical protein
MDREAKQRELARLQAAVRELETELAQEPPANRPGQEQGPPSGIWPPPKYYTAYHVLAGCVLGMLAACTSLLFNVVGSAMVGQHSLQLIRVYLTFPMGAEALHVEGGLLLALGCCLYLGTGMLLGVPVHLVLTAWFGSSPFASRFAAATLMGLALWLLNFYGILSWLEPLLFGGRWIVEQIPWWVAALTHLIFAWTILLIQPLGVFVPYQTSVINR